MRVVWIGGARNVERLGFLVDGQVYDLPDDVAGSLLEQGKAELPPVEKPLPRPVPKFDKFSDKPAARSEGKE